MTGQPFTLDTAKTWAPELGIRIPRGSDPDFLQGWMDRVRLAGETGEQRHIDDANRYAG